MSIFHPNLFLFLVAIFSVHLSLSGYRASVARKSKDQNKSRLIDKSIASGSLLVYVLLIGWGIYTIILSEDPVFGIIAIVLGMIALRFSLSQLRRLNKASADKLQWWFEHMQGMVGSYIATVSAFSAVNVYFLPPILRWLWPTIIGSIGLSIWINYYKKKFKKLVANKTFYM